MDYLIGVMANVGDVAAHADDDQVDRLSHRYTTFFLVIFAILVSTKQFVGDAISCWVPAQFTHNHEDYTNKVCWVSSTYYLPFERTDIPDDGAPRERVGYYQWIPMILMIQAVLFYTPCLMWRVLNKRSGLNLKAVIDAGVTWQQITFVDARERSLSYMVHHVSGYLNSRRDVINMSCWANTKRMLSRKCMLVFALSYGNYLTSIYLIAKLLYIANAIGQIFMLNCFLNTDYHMFGVNVIKSLIRGDEWTRSVRFPRVTLCDFEVRNLANIHRHTVQCVLPINLFNEKIFLFIWFWFVLVSMVTVLSFLQWTYRSTSSNDQEMFISRLLVTLKNVTTSRDTKETVRKFIGDHLRQDGIFILRMLVKNAGDQVAHEVLAALWKNYIRENRLPEIQSSGHVILHTRGFTDGELV